MRCDTSFAWLLRVGAVSGLLCLGAPPRAVSQTSTGSIRGYVTDSSGAPLEGATVSAVSVQTGPSGR